MQLNQQVIEQQPNHNMPPSPREQKQKEKQKQNHPVKRSEQGRVSVKKEENGLDKEELLQNSRQSLIKNDPTKLDKKNTSVHLPSLYNNSPKMSLSVEEEKHKSDKIKKLTSQNKKLIEQMKKLNDKLTQIINKQASKSLRKRQPQGNSDSQLAKELQNAYKQIDTYKKMISKQKSKQLPIEQMSRINDLENKIKSTEAEAKQIKKQIKTIDDIQKMQQKEITRTQSQGPKAKMNKLVQQIQDQKQELKTIRKEALKLEENIRPQHEYLVYLEKLHKELTDTKHKKETNTGKQVFEASEEEWQQLIQILTKSKQENKQLMKKIQTMRKHKTKINNDWQSLDLKLKERIKHLTTVEKKFHDTKLLVITIRHPRNEEKFSQLEHSGSMSQKRWDPNPINVVNSEEKNKGQVVGNSKLIDADLIKINDYTAFPDKVLKIKLEKLYLWTSEEGELSGIQAHYLLNQHKLIQGNRIGNCSKEANITIDLHNDEIINIRGRINQNGFIVSLHLEKKSGKIVEVGELRGEGKEFGVFGDQQYLECLEGVFVQKTQGESSICELKFNFTHLKLSNTA